MARDFGNSMTERFSFQSLRSHAIDLDSILMGVTVALTPISAGNVDAVGPGSLGQFTESAVELILT